MTQERKAGEELQREVAELRQQLSALQDAAANWARTETSLRKSERHLCTLLSNLPGMAYRCRNDTQWTMEFVSEGCGKLTGHDCADLLGNRAISWNELIHPEDRPIVHQEIERAIDQQRQFEIVYRIRTAEGAEKWIWERGIGVSEEGGPVEFVEGFITDISERVLVEKELERRVDARTAELAEVNSRLRQENLERQRAEEALRQHRDELQAIYDGLPDGLVIVDIGAKRCLQANARWCRMLGYSQDDLPRSPEKVHPPEQIPSIAKKFQAQADGRAPLAENIPFVCKDGTVFLADIASNRIQYHGRPCLVSFIRDTTERHRAQEALQVSEERFRAIFEEAPVGMVIGDADRRISRVNQALCRITGYAPEELIGRRVEEFIFPEDRETSGPLLAKLLSGKIPSFTVERRYIARGGRVFWAQATTAAIHGPDGKLAFGLGIIDDIDERKRAQEAVERERKTLWHMLRSSDHERQLIAYDIHDGLAQQLAAAIMQFQTYEHLKAHEPESAKTAYDAGVQMVRQAHFEARRLISGVRPPILDESGVVAALAHLVHDQQVIGGPRIEFQSNVQFGRLEPILENAVYRIAQEALANACKHSRSPRVRLSLVQIDSSIRLVVQDWGIGFDPDSVGSDRFGLEGIRERTRLLGGTVAITSLPQQGARIEVVLPIMPAGPPGGHPEV